MFQFKKNLVPISNEMLRALPVDAMDDVISLIHSEIGDFKLTKEIREKAQAELGVDAKTANGWQVLSDVLEHFDIVSLAKKHPHAVGNVFKGIITVVGLCFPAASPIMFKVALVPKSIAIKIIEASSFATPGHLLYLFAKHQAQKPKTLKNRNFKMFKKKDFQKKQEAAMEYKIETVCDGFYTIEQNGVRSFLFVGENDALLVDTCFGGDLKAAVESITDLPVTLITTHADRDHIGSDGQFETHFMHPAEFEIYERKNQKKPCAYPLWEGDVFRAGDYALEVILIPGHTPGGIALLDREHKFILCGDTVQAHTIYMHGDGRNLQAFYYSVEKLQNLRDGGAFDKVYASHGQLEVPADILEEHLTLAQQLIEGTAEPIGDAPDHFPKTVKTYGFGRVKMFYEMK